MTLFLDIVLIIVICAALAVLVMFHLTFGGPIPWRWKDAFRGWLARLRGKLW